MTYKHSIVFASALATSLLSLGCAAADDGAADTSATSSSTGTSNSSASSATNPSSTTTTGSEASSGVTADTGMPSGDTSSSGGASTSGGANSSATSDSTTSADASTGTTGPELGDYSDCANNGPASCPMGEFCVQVYVGAACGLLDCATAMDCPTPSTGDATVSCETLNVEPFGTVCALTCENGEACPDGMECVNEFACLWRIPGWTCDAAFYGVDDGCDCGCGIVDPDCADATLASCDFCDDPGSCTELPCETAPIIPDNNAMCM